MRTVGAVEQFVASANACGVEIGQGVGVGNEVLLKGTVTGVGLEYEGSLVHLAAFPRAAD
jgi:hypothetical protein